MKCHCLKRKSYQGKDDRGELLLCLRHLLPVCPLERDSSFFGVP